MSRIFSILSISLMLVFASITAGIAQEDPFAAPSESAVVALTTEDYQAWGSFAQGVEEALQDRRTALDTLTQLREAVVGWRARFSDAQTGNTNRLVTVRTQLEALGPPPEEGVEEAAEIAERRAELRAQVVSLEAPLLAADEALTRANGLIGEIDTLVRERQTEALLQLYPTPLNPAIWPQAGRVLVEEAREIWGEVSSNYQASQDPTPLRTNMPLIVGLLLFALVTFTRTQQMIDAGLTSISVRFKSRRGGNAFGILVSTGRVIFPTAGVYAFCRAAELTGLVGPSGLILLDVLPSAGATLFAGIWVASITFPKHNDIFNPLGLEKAVRRRARLLVMGLGAMTALMNILNAWIFPQIGSEAILSVLSAPLSIMVGVCLWQMGGILRHAGKLDVDNQEGETSTSVFNRVMRTLGVVTRLASVLGVLAMMIGYVPASLAIVFPTALSLGLVFFLLILILLETDIYDVVTNRPPDSPPGLLSSLVALGLVVVSVPFFALIWGVSRAELMEYWVVFLNGFSFGESRIRPGDFLVFLLIFSLGYVMTKVMQSVISTSVLTRTRMHLGSQKAMLSGIGYVGVFLSAIAAFTLAGIDLSSLALVLGALSVGIGFGLQNIVSNFVSGIILLIERPVSEGDWIEVNGVMGTVRGVSVRSTTIETFDRTDVIVPNADLVSGAVTNWTRFNRSGRLIIKVGVAYGTDTRRVIEILEAIGRDQSGVSQFPAPPQGLFRGFGDSSLNFELRLILRDVSEIMTIETEVHHQILEAFVKEGIEIPFVQRDVWIRNPEVLMGEKT